MQFVRVLSQTYDFFPSLLYENTFDIFNCWSNLVIRKRSHLYIPIGFKFVLGGDEGLIIVDRYGFCVENRLEVQNVVIQHDNPVCIKITNNSSEDVFIPQRKILCQIMVPPKRKDKLCELF